MNKHKFINVHKEVKTQLLQLNGRTVPLGDLRHVGTDEVELYHSPVTGRSAVISYNGEPEYPWFATVLFKDVDPMKLWGYVKEVLYQKPNRYYCIRSGQLGRFGTLHQHGMVASIIETNRQRVLDGPEAYEIIYLPLLTLVGEWSVRDLKKGD